MKEGRGRKEGEEGRKEGEVRRLGGKMMECKEGRMEGEGRKVKEGRTLEGVPRTSMLRDSSWTKFLKKEGRKVEEGRKAEEGRKYISEGR